MVQGLRRFVFLQLAQGHALAEHGDRGLRIAQDRQGGHAAPEPVAREGAARIGCADIILLGGTVDEAEAAGEIGGLARLGQHIPGGAAALDAVPVQGDGCGHLLGPVDGEALQVRRLRIEIQVSGELGPGGDHAGAPVGSRGDDPVLIGRLDARAGQKGVHGDPAGGADHGPAVGPVRIHVSGQAFLGHGEKLVPAVGLDLRRLARIPGLGDYGEGRFVIGRVDGGELRIPHHVPFDGIAAVIQLLALGNGTVQKEAAEEIAFLRRGSGEGYDLPGGDLRGAVDGPGVRAPHRRQGAADGLHDGDGTGIRIFLRCPVKDRETAAVREGGVVQGLQERGLRSGDISVGVKGLCGPFLLLVVAHVVRAGAFHPVAVVHGAFVGGGDAAGVGQALRGGIAGEEAVLHRAAALVEAHDAAGAAAGDVVDGDGTHAGFYGAHVVAGNAAASPGGALAVLLNGAGGLAPADDALVVTGYGRAAAIAADVRSQGQVLHGALIDAEETVGLIVAAAAPGIILSADPQTGDGMTAAVEETGKIRPFRHDVVRRGRLADGHPGIVLAAQVDIPRQEERKSLAGVPCVHPGAEGPQLPRVRNAVSSRGGLRPGSQLRHGPVRRICRQLRRGRLHPQARQQAEEQDQGQQQAEALFQVPCHCLSSSF